MRKVALILGTVALTGCNTLSDWFPMPPPSTVRRVDDRLTASVFVQDGACPAFTASQGLTGQALPALVAAGIPVVIELATDAIKEAVQQAQDDLTTAYVAAGVVTPITRPASAGAAGDLKCIIVARGRFGTYDRTVHGERVNKGAITPTILDRIGAVEQPSLYVEIQVGPAPDAPKAAPAAARARGRAAAPPAAASELAFRPVFIQFNDTAARNPGWNGKKNIGVLLALSPKPLTGDAAKKADDAVKEAGLVGIPFNFGEMKRGTFIRSPLAADVSDPLHNLARNLPAGTGGANPLAGLTNGYAFVTESADPTLFDKVILAGAKSDPFSKFMGELGNYIGRRLGANKPAKS